jgi:hypothetical protein
MRSAIAQSAQAGYGEILHRQRPRVCQQAADRLKGPVNLSASK